MNPDKHIKKGSSIGPGRPKREVCDLPMDWQREVLQLASEGAGLKEIKARVGISNTLHTRWLAEDDEYSETIKKALLISEAWWLMTGRTNLLTKDFNNVLWYMNMKNRFNWSDSRPQAADAGDTRREVPPLIVSDIKPRPRVDRE